MRNIPEKNKDHLRIAVFGDITGAAGRATAKEIFPLARSEWGADLIIANGENASSGFGLTPKHAQEIKSYDLDLMTLGNHTWDKNILRHRIDQFPFIARPLNMPRETPGTGHVVTDTPFGKFAVINVLGRLFMNPSDCPYHAAYDLIKLLKTQGVKMIALDMHAEASAEKQIMGYFLDGKIALVWGTHTHIPTADEKILPSGTGYITDIGMTGAANSVIGFEVGISLKKMIYGEPNRFKPETKGERISSGIVADIDPTNGLTKTIYRFSEYFPEITGLSEDTKSQELG